MRFPTGLTNPTDDPNGYAYMGWHTRLLPYVEQETLWHQSLDAYAQFPNDFSKSPPHPLGVVVKIYGCPSDSRVSQPQLARGKRTVGLTSYLGVSGTRTSSRNGMIFRNSKIRYADVTDGTSHTIFVGERPPSTDFWFGWWYAGYGLGESGFADMLLGVNDLSPINDAYVPDCGPKPGGFKPGRVDSMCSTFHFWSLHPGGGHFLFVDGSVKFLKYSAASVMPALATRAGNDDASISD